MTERRAGRFVVLEGIDGAGTTTQVAKLVERLRREGAPPVRATREPSDGPIGALVRQVLSGRIVSPGGRAPGWATMALLFAADRMDHVESEIEPFLADGGIVVSDRYDASSLAYQSVSSGSGGERAVDWIRQLNTHALRPDLTIVVDLPPDVAAERRASRGEPGGLASAVNDAVDVMDAMGKDVVIIETVGVGQGELAIAKIAHTVLLTLVPGYGDALQAMKAGIIEIADVIAVNKSDMPGSQQVVQELHAQGLEHVSDDGSAVWTVPVTAVSARRGEGIDELVDSIAAHRAFTDAHGWTEVREHLRRQQQLRDLIHRHIEDEVMADLTSTATFERWSRRLDAGEVDPAGAARAVVGELRRHIALLEQGSDPGREATDPETAFSPQRQHHTRHEPESEVPSR